MRRNRILIVSLVTALLGSASLLAQPAQRRSTGACDNHGYSFTEDPCVSSEMLLSYCSGKLTQHFGMTCVAGTASYCTGAGHYQCSTQN